MSPEYLQFWNSFTTMIYALSCLLGIVLLIFGLGWVFVIYHIRKISNNVEDVRDSVITGATRIVRKR